jgi:hypothetical protein
MQVPFSKVPGTLKLLFLSNYQQLLDADNSNLLYSKNIDFNIQLTLK